MLFIRKISGKIISYEKSKEMLVPKFDFNLSRHEREMFRDEMCDYYDRPVFFICYYALCIEYSLQGFTKQIVLDKAYFNSSIRVADFIELEYNWLTGNVALPD